MFFFAFHQKRLRQRCVSLGRRVWFVSASSSCVRLLGGPGAALGAGVRGLGDGLRASLAIWAAG